ncbi:hypothetical protein BGX23_002585 [Mortierella sp. AD031]|nr:hypothetical protein BGX23_002585 [Mortierella sp. AD031]KAG0214577.1 hypothetical protein BGX33_001999 [Mortierella sp. NVP41]
MAADRNTWEDSISRLLQKAQSHKEVYTVPISGFEVSIHPNVYSPKYFPESKWYGQQLERLIRPGQDFLEVGVGSGIVSLHVARAGGRCKGVDINPDAVAITRKNFEANGFCRPRKDSSFSSASASPEHHTHPATTTGTTAITEEADIRVSDLYSALDPGSRFHYVFWNHPWQNSTSIVKELQTEKTLDEGYRALSRYMSLGREYLHDDGAILIGTSCYADLEALDKIAAENGFRTTVQAQGTSLLEDGTEEVYYILRLVDLQA